MVQPLSFWNYTQVRSQFTEQIPELLAGFRVWEVYKVSSHLWMSQAREVTHHSYRLSGEAHVLC